ncbi:MAG: glycosyltransferase [Promethearchaeota archaeon]
MNIVSVTPFYDELIYGIKSKPNSSLILLSKELSKYEKNIIISSKIEDSKSLSKINSNLFIIRFKPLFYLPEIPYVLDPLLFIKIFKILKKYNCNVLIGYSLQFFSCFSAAISSKLFGCPFICRIIGTGTTSNKKLIDIISKLYDHSLARFTLKIAKKIFIQSENIKKQIPILNKYLKKTVIVEDGLDLSRYKEDINTDELKSEFKINKSNIIISFTSRLYKLKGIEDLIDVAKKIVKKKKNVIFLIVGTGPLEKKLKFETKTIESIKILGFRTDIPKILAISDIFVQPSYSEGLSLAILEACASGLPIITTNVGSNPDLIKNGKNGYLIKPGDRTSLEKYIIKLIENKKLREEMGKYNREMILKKYDLKKICLKFLLELKKVVNNDS